MRRREFLRSTAAVGSGLALASRGLGQVGDAEAAELNIALLGAGSQGQVLLHNCAKIAGVRVTAVCDIWTEYNQRKASRILDRYGHEHTAYADYREMLERQRGLDAVLIATPDFWHAEQATACLRAGLHVYCECPMSNTVDSGRQMVRAARETGKLLQIGYQRRSNPRYAHCAEKLLREVGLLGRITAVNAQWNRPVQLDRGWPRRATLDEETLKKYRYASMRQFRNWRWYKGAGGGPLAALGSHQIDVFNWYLGARPRAVMASGGTEYYDTETHQWPDTVMAIYEYETKRGIVRAFYQMVNTNGNLGHYERFLGDQGALVISEAGGFTGVSREETALDWDRWVDLGYLTRPAKREAEDEEEAEGEAAISVTETHAPFEYGLPGTFDEPCHKPHLENFFDTIRGKATLACLPESAHEAAVAVAKINEALESGRKVRFTPGEFEA